MRSCTSALVAWAAVLAHALLVSASQTVFSAPSNASIERKPFGRFLHITDLHPDPHYKHASAVHAACHHTKPKKHKADGKQRAGWFGTALSDCDSPPRLVESSLQWAANNLVGKDGGIDFVIWTGDSARHDNDDKLPRSSKEIFELNRWTLDQLERAFPGVPLVPSVGNNDIFPHNILFPGPNAVTKEYVQIWQDHVPEYEFHTFEQGGYYVKELLPNRLAAMSLNTLYFYDNNKAVDGCVRTKGKHKDVDPGTAQLDWLEVQLDLFRQRGMQVHLLGHVPPTAGNYFARCYKRYTDIVLRFQDTIVAQHFGHMNTDAFFIQEDQEAVYTAAHNDAEVLQEGLPGDLRQDYSTLPGKGRTDEDLYSVFFIAPSIIPTYYPSMRLWTYNTTESARYTATTTTNTTQDDDDTDEVEQEDDDDVDLDDDEGMVGVRSRHHHRPVPPKKRKGKKHKKRRRARHASAASPSRTNTYLSLLGYSQWVMDIDAQNDAVERILHRDTLKKHDDDDEKRRKEAEAVEVDYRLEYATYPGSVLWAAFHPESGYTGPEAVPKRLLEKELHRAGVASPWSKGKLAKPLRRMSEYALESVSVRTMMDLARRLMVDKKLWRRFVRRIYSESGYEP